MEETYYGEANPVFLYRYRPLTEDGGRDVVRDELDLIKNGFIWLSTPKVLNDPFDCRPICTAAQEGRLDQLLAKFLVGCMSAIPPNAVDASPMWSYYADSHRGICIEFPFDRARAAMGLPIERVRYSNTRLDIRSLDHTRMRITSPRRLGVVVAQEEVSDPINNIEILELSRKSEAWRHEQEWRFIWSQNHERPPEAIAREIAEHGAMAGHKAFVSRPSRVIFGANMDAARKCCLANLCRDIGVSTVEAYRSEAEYRIEYRPKE